MPNTATQAFEQELKKAFNKYLKNKPKPDDSFDGAMKRIMWMKETAQKVNEESGILIKKHAGDDEGLKKEMQTISMEHTKKLMAQMKD